MYFVFFLAIFLTYTNMNVYLQNLFTKRMYGRIVMHDACMSIMNVNVCVGMADALFGC